MAQGVFQDVVADAMMKYAASGGWDKNDTSLEKMRVKIEKFVRARSVKNFPDYLVRQSYCKSPVVRRLNSMAFGKGTVYVMYVPSGRGKTTASQVFLRCSNKKTTRGIAFCPPLQGASTFYLDLIGDEFGIDKNNPPKGWLNFFLNTLAKIAAEDMKTSLYIILDDYMSYGINVPECNLLVAIKSLIRGTNVNVIVMTQNKEAADHALTLNSWHSIIPLACLDVVLEQRSKEDPGERKMDWETHLNTKWGLKNLVEAAMLDDRNKEFATTEEEMRRKIESVLSSLSEEYRKKICPSDIPAMLLERRHQDEIAADDSSDGSRIAPEVEDDNDESAWRVYLEGQCGCTIS
jgi:hypothetical protein